MSNDELRDIRDALLPNVPRIHPQVELLSATEWKEIATLQDDCVFYVIRITHTVSGDAVLIAYKDNEENELAMGPYFGDISPPLAGLPPCTEIQRNARPKHIYAKLHPDYYIPPVGPPQASGPTVVVEEWRSVMKQGQVDEESRDPEAAQGALNSFTAEVSKEQGML